MSRSASRISTTHSGQNSKPFLSLLPAQRSLPSRDGSVMPVDSTTFEKHYRIGELAEIWGLGRETVRRLVKDDPGVIKIRMGRKKAHTVYSVPESAAQRIHTRLLNAA